MTQTEALRLALVEINRLCDTGKITGATIETIQSIKAALEAKDGCQCPACKVAPHASDCAVHSEPAHPAGDCNCGANGEPVAWLKVAETLGGFGKFVEAKPNEKGAKPVYAAPQKQPPVIDKSVARRIATQLGWEPPRTPLTDEEITEIFSTTKGLDFYLNFARAIEAAHKIKGEA